MRLCLTLFLAFGVSQGSAQHFPLGGIGTGMVYLKATGALSYVGVGTSALFHGPKMSAAIAIEGKAGSARVLEGIGVGRFQETHFLARFPFGEVYLQDPHISLSVSVKGWSPFIPTSVDNGSLPVAGLEYTFTNTGSKSVRYIFSFKTTNFWTPGGPVQSVEAVDRGFILSQEGSFAVVADDFATVIHDSDSSATGTSLVVPFGLAPGASKTITLRLCWYASPNTGVAYKPWYTSRFANIGQVMSYWSDNYAELRKATQLFTTTLYTSTLPAEATRAVTASLTIFKSDSLLRDFNGRARIWDGPKDTAGDWTTIWDHALALTGVRYDAVNKTVYVHPRGNDFTGFLATRTGFGNVVYKNGQAHVKVVFGAIDVAHIKIY